MKPNLHFIIISLFLMLSIKFVHIQHTIMMSCIPKNYNSPLMVKLHKVCFFRDVFDLVIAMSKYQESAFFSCGKSAAAAA